MDNPFKVIVFYLSMIIESSCLALRSHMVNLLKVVHVKFIKSLAIFSFNISWVPPP